MTFLETTNSQAARRLETLREDRASVRTVPRRPLQAKDGAQLQPRQWGPRERIKGEQRGQLRLLGVALKGRHQALWPPSAWLRSRARAVRVLGSRLALALGLAKCTFLRLGSLMARGASSAMACAVYEPLFSLEIDCLS